MEKVKNFLTGEFGNAKIIASESNKILSEEYDMMHYDTVS